MRAACALDSPKMKTSASRPVWITALALIIILAIPLGLGAIAGTITSANIADWYEHLDKPDWRPPNHLFAPVWTTLYILMGISAFLVWRLPRSEERTQALVLYTIQLFLNFAWSFLFFHFKWLGLAFAEMALLWIFIWLLIIRTYPLSKVAALIQIPYMIWVSFAAVLNLSVYTINS